MRGTVPIRPAVVPAVEHRAVRPDRCSARCTRGRRIASASDRRGDRERGAKRPRGRRHRNTACMGSHGPRRHRSGDTGKGAKELADPSRKRRTGLTGKRKRRLHAATLWTGIPSCLALSTRFPVMPEPGKAMTPLGSRFSNSSLRLKGAALPWAFQSGRHTT